MPDEPQKTDLANKLAQIDAVPKMSMKRRKRLEWMAINSIGSGAGDSRGGNVVAVAAQDQFARGDVDESNPAASAARMND